MRVRDVVVRDEARLDAAAREHLFEQLHRPAVYVEHGYDLVARLARHQSGYGFRRHSTGGDDCGFGAFQGGNLFLGRSDGGIAVTGIKIQLAVALGVSAEAVHTGNDEDRSLGDGRRQRRSLAVALFSRVHTASRVSALVWLLLHERSLSGADLADALVGSGSPESCRAPSE